MKNVEKLGLVAIAAALLAPVLAGAVPEYGRTGRAVGAAGIERIASYVSPQDLKEFDSGNGRAGSAVGKAPEQTQKPARKVDVAAAWFGPAGGQISA